MLDNLRTFQCNGSFVIGGIRICLGVFSDPMFLGISSTSCPLNFLLVQGHQAETIIIKRLIQGRNNIPGCGLNSDHAIRDVVKMTPLPSPQRCQLIYQHTALPLPHNWLNYFYWNSRSIKIVEFSELIRG